MGNSNSHNQPNTPQLATPSAKSTTTPVRPSHPPRKKSIELPDLRASLALSPTSPPSQPIPINQGISFRPEASVRSPSRPLAIANPRPAPRHPAMLDLESSPADRRRASSSYSYELDTPLVVTPPPAQPPPRAGSRSAPPRRPEPIGPVEGYILSSIPLGLDTSITTGPVGNHISSEPPQLTQSSDDSTLPITITWKGHANNVFVAGTFDNAWNGRTRLSAEYVTRSFLSFAL